ncbi:ATP-binding cassette sub-family C member 4-like [Zophobas morio]|uniref:ATP-binding cassette sub-family C member 4-like n=1 Tax=Zophobas morio TaxID=2755281 RepID=UPI0030829831
MTQVLKINPTLVENGKMINLITRDVSEFEDAIYNITNILRDLSNAVAACCVLYSEIGGITAVTGPIGSGKSLVLKVLTKEYKNVEGDLEVVGSISYVSQEPWLFPSTIKQNILFGSSYDENRYLEVLQVCALLEELRLLTDGDSSIVIDGGANLSKGQKARINLARAVYKERDIYLLDDCLASLDTIVADFVFEQCIKRFLKDKIVILATSSIKYVNRSDNVITLKNGTVQSKKVHSKAPRNAETKNGLTTIRTSRIQDTLRKEFDQHQDLYASSSYMYACCEKAYLLLIGADQIILLIFAIILFLALDDKMTAGKVGLVLSQIFSLTGAQLVFYCMMTRLENQMITVERVLEYTKQKQENKDGLVIEHWPKECEIRFKDVYLSYKSDQDHVLKHLNFSIKNKEKVAIVGSTGSGKTSLISTLIRLYDFEGNIFIDNVDIKTLPMDFLRSKISVIPQEPTIFSGTLRENIDPKGQHSDDDIWKAISTVNLSLFQNLDERIDMNLSICEKQLICVCRALIQRNKIVIFDECNASVDSDTEALIQKVISENFAECTVIAIMHKLRYILDFDLVLVVDKGVIIESGDPSSLLKKKNGMLSNLFKRQ